MQRLTSPARPKGRAPGIPPPTGRAPKCAATIVPGPQPLDNRDGSLRSAHRQSPPSVDPCSQCGFQAVAPAGTSSALRALPQACRDALRRGDHAVVEEVARLRDELHAVANRVARLLVAPGSTLAAMDIGSPTALAGPSNPELLVAILTMAAGRLADITDRLGEADWRLVGQLGPETVTVGQLVEVPLHSAHRLLSATPGPLRTSAPLPGVRDAQATHRRPDVAALDHTLPLAAMPRRVG
jgi:hypothetical protein